MIKKWLVCYTIVIAFTSYASAHGQCGSTELHGIMINIKDDLKLLSIDVKAGKSNSAIERSDILIAHFKNSRSEFPYSLTLESFTEDEREIAREKYQSLIDDAILVFEDLKTALTQSDSPKIRQLFGEIGTLRNKGHRTFKKGC